MKVKFSIVIPVYNAENYIDSCLKSVINQTYTNYEVIIIDDGSTDSSCEICKTYERSYDNIRLYTQSNSGQFKARLLGVQNSLGEYILFLDSDDYFKNFTLESLFNIVNKYECDMVIYGLEKVDIHNRVFEAWSEDNEISFLYDTKSIIFKMLSDVRYNSICRKCLKRNLLLGPYPDLDIRHGEDLMQSICSAAKVKSAVVVSDILYCYRQNVESVTNCYDINRYFKDSVKIYEYIYHNFILTSNFEKHELCVLRNYFNSVFIDIIRVVASSGIAHNDKINLYKYYQNSDIYILFLKNGTCDDYKKRLYFLLYKINFWHLIVFLEKMYVFLRGMFYKKYEK